MLDQNGVIRVVEPHQITRSKDMRHATALDAEGQSLYTSMQATEILGEVSHLPFVSLALIFTETQWTYIGPAQRRLCIPFQSRVCLDYWRCIRDPQYISCIDHSAVGQRC